MPNRCLGSLLAVFAILFISGCGSQSAPPPVTISLISVSPGTPSLAAGATQQFKATATYNNGTTADVTSQASWSSSNTSVASINGAGMLTAEASGSATVTATMNGVNGTASLTVTATVTTPPTLSSIAITPGNATFAVGATQQFTATGTYSDGSTNNITSTVTWGTSSSATATISATGLATGVAAGTANVTAALTGVTGTTAFTVTATTGSPTLVSIAVTPATASITAGATQQFTATGTYSDSSTQNITSTVTWASSNTAAATVSAAGLATGVAAGTSNVTATLSGVTGTGALTVTTAVTTPTLVSIAVTPVTASVAAGATQQFTATGTYSDSSTQNITSTVTWASSNTAAATVSATGLATGVAAGTTSVTATLSGVTGTAALTVTATTKTISSIAVTPASPSFAAGSTQQFTATATYSDGSTGNVTSTATWTSANTAVATVSADGLATGVAAGSTSIQASLSGVNGSTTITVTTATSSGANVTTWHFDNNRSGLNPNEVSLTPSNVSASTFGKLFSYQTDGYTYGAPLLVSNLTINGVKHNVLFVATENDSVFAFDADSYGTGAPLWQVSLLQSGETPLTGAAIQPVLGVTSTPVIDTSSNTIYVVSTEKPSGGTAGFRLNALDLTTGAHKFGSPVAITASEPGTGNTSVNGVVSLNTSCIQRAALLEANSTIYIGFGSCQRGWLLAYDAQSLAQVGVFNTSPNLNGEGTYMSAGGIWMGGGGPVADGSGNVYVVTGNGPWDGQTAWADSVLKFNAKLQLTDWFTPDSFQYADCADADLASGGLMLLPGTSQVLAGGKIGKLFLVNTGNMGHETTGDTGAAQALWFEGDLITPYSASCTDSAGVNTTDINPYEIFGTAAYFNGSVYLGITPTGANVQSGVRQFTYNGTLTPGPISTPYFQENTRGITPFISANGSNNGIVWMIDQGQPIQNSGGNTPTAATLHAYDAQHYPTELYSSSTNSTDVPGYAIKFSSPVVANGKVYISTAHDLNTAASPKGEIDVYGLK